MNRREFLAGITATSIIALNAARADGLPGVSLDEYLRQNVPMRFTDRPCMFAPNWDVCSTCGLTPTTIDLRGLHCGLQKREGWRVMADADGYMHWGDASGPYMTQADFRDAPRGSLND